ncbi:MAG TPA: hypothetical protein VLV16_08880 [Gemmatimonadales bacterium]|nr:hypothetical protein [Gemmatimonadales bacterium]
MRRAWRGAAGLVGLAAFAAPVRAQDSAATRFARVTYLTGASVYLDAGRLDGLREGTRVEIVRGRTAVAVLKVAYLASHQASCDIVTTAAALVVGDSARFVPIVVPRDSGLAQPVPATALARRGTTPPGLRGRIGIEFLGVDQLEAGVGGFTQPGMSLRVDGHPLGEPAVTVAVDIRARRTYSSLSDGTPLTDARNRVYQAALTFGAPGSVGRATVGRQISPNLASVGMFDGVLAEVNQPGWSAGMFGGAQPDPIGLQFSTQILEAGAYVQGHSSPGAANRWALALGASGSYDSGQANREFAFVQTSFLSPRFWMLLTQELDYYRPWKRMTGGSAVSPTSTFALLRYRLTGSMTLDAGFDNRRNVVLYRDVVNPVTAFDDAYRQGVWGGWSVRVNRRFLFAADARSSRGGPAGRADAYSVSFIAGPFSSLGMRFRSRTTRYLSDQPPGWLQSVAIGIEPGSRLHLELNGGVREQWNPLTDPASNSWVNWIGVDLDMDVAGSWYFVMSANRETGGFDGNNQVYGGLSYRF